LNRRQSLLVARVPAATAFHAQSCGRVVTARGFIEGRAHRSRPLFYMEPAVAHLCATRRFSAIVDSEALRCDGVLLSRARGGRARFNFTQVVTLCDGVAMDWSSRHTLQVETLAANILIRFLPERGRYAQLCPECLIGKRARSHGLIWQFCRQVLVTLPPQGSQLPPDFIEAWLLAHLRILEKSGIGRSTGNRARRRLLPRGVWMPPGEIID
jgi:hypothetical protein